MSNDGTDHGDLEDDARVEQEVARCREARRAKTVRLDGNERERLKRLHWMHCPKCGGELDEITFRGVKVDKCFSCGGVYLDDGELEQLAGKQGWFEAMLTFMRR